MEIEYTEEQLSVIDNALDALIKKREPVFITGPAGCGKSTIASKIAHELFSRDTVKSIYLAAPTHTASRRLTECIVVNGTEKTLHTASTIHRFLGLKLENIKYGKQIWVRDYKTLTYESFIKEGSYLIVDEASMLTDFLFDQLLESCRERIIFLGDSCQIPPVPDGDDRKQLYKFEYYNPKVLTVKNRFELTKVFRQNKSSSLYNLCESIRNLILEEESDCIYDSKHGFMNFVRNLPNDKSIVLDFPQNKVVNTILKFPDTCFIAYGNPTIQKVQSYLPEWYKIGGYAVLDKSISVVYDEKSKTIFNNNDHILLENIIIRDRTRYGINFDLVTGSNLNGRHDFLCPSEPDQFKNQIDQLYNIIKFNEGKLTKKLADEEYELRKNNLDLQTLTNKMINEFLAGVSTLRDARVSTVHKAQGQQWENVIIAYDNIMFSGKNGDKELEKVDKYRKMYAAKMLYTAISRAKKRVIFCMGYNNMDYEPV